ncbi:MAG TPA: hypothetical protein VJN89_21225, partial [Candidatus Acidoferrum sp.]|nr:hypothetical protein [Candidatus Acidoferrum sp.]
SPAEMQRSGRLRLPARRISPHCRRQKLSRQTIEVSYDPVRGKWGQVSARMVDDRPGLQAGQNPVIVGWAFHIVRRRGAVTLLLIVGIWEDTSERERILNTIKPAKNVTVRTVTIVGAIGTDSIWAAIIGDGG